MNNKKQMKKLNLSKKDLIQKYALIEHPEGGYYREVYRSETELSSPVHHQIRASVTHIYFLLTKNDISRFHKVCHDEIWNFYDGDPIELITFDGTGINTKTIGPECLAYFHVVKADVYQAAQSTGEYSLVGCSVAPGFDFDDFSFLKDQSSDMVSFKPFLNSYQKFI